MNPSESAESQSNHSGHSDSGVDTNSHGRSQSVVSSIFSEAWKRGTQIEENTKVTRALCRTRTALRGGKPNGQNVQLLPI